MSCNCDLQISNLSNRISDLTSNISNIYTLSTSTYNLSNVISANYANIYSNISSPLFYYTSNVYIGNVIGFDKNIIVSNIFPNGGNLTSNTLFYVSSDTNQILMNTSSGNATLYISQNANVSGNLNVGNVNTIYNYLYKGNSIINGATNRKAYNYHTSQLNWVISNPWKYSNLANSYAWQSVVWAPELGIFSAISGNRAGVSSDGVNWSTYSISTLTRTNHCWSPTLRIFCSVATGYTETSSDGITWSAVATPNAGQQARGICWSPQLGIFCVVFQSGTGNRVMTSPDGVNWTMRNTPANNSWNSVCWSAELNLLCAVAYSGTGSLIMTSPDGITWTGRTAPASNGWYSITWSPTLRLFCAVGTSGSGNRVMTSPDGITWTLRSTAGLDNQWRSIVWCPELKVFNVCGGELPLTLKYSMYSRDGINWYGYNVPDGGRWTSICWSGELGIFVSVSFDSKYGIYSKSIYTHYTSISELGNVGNIAFDGDLLFLNNSTQMIGIGNSNPTYDLDVYGNISIAKRGASYGTKSTFYTFNSYQPFRFDLDSLGNLSINSANLKNLYFTGSNSSNAVLTFGLNSNIDSTYQINGYTNIYGNLFIQNANLTTSNMNISVGSNTFEYNVSQQKITFGNIFVGNIVNNSGNILCIGGGNANITGNVNLTSYQRSMASPYFSGSFYHPYKYQYPNFGIPQQNWITSNSWTYGSISSTVTWRSVDWSPALGIFCAVGDGGGATSADGKSWTLSSLSSGSWSMVVWSPELAIFCAISSGGVSQSVATSADGLSWTLQTTPSTNQWWGLCWSTQLGIFCAVGSTGTANRVMTSRDGITWTLQNTTGADLQWRSICWSSNLGLFCAVAISGTGSRVMTSPNGVNWTMRSTPVDNNWRFVCWSPQLGIFCAVSRTGSGNQVMTSRDGITWTLQSTTGLDNLWTYILWCPELNLFYASADGASYFIYSRNGVNWFTHNAPGTATWQTMGWSPQLGIFVSLTFDTKTVAYTESMYGYTAHIQELAGNLGVMTGNLAFNGNILFVASNLGNVGIFTSTPRGNLEVLGEAAKTGGGNWSTSSDERVKEDIQEANVVLLYDIVKSLDLKYYTYKEEYLHSTDQHVLGWIAQDVEKYFPKSILRAYMYGYDDFRLLDYDQLLKAMYGALQKVVDDIEELEKIVEENDRLIQETRI